MLGAGDTRGWSGQELFWRQNNRTKDHVSDDSQNGSSEGL